MTTHLHLVPILTMCGANLYYPYMLNGMMYGSSASCNLYLIYVLIYLYIYLLVYLFSHSFIHSLIYLWLTELFSSALIIQCSITGLYGIMSQSQWPPGQYRPPLLNTQHTCVSAVLLSFASPLQAQVLQEVLQNFKQRSKNARNINP